VPFGSLAADDEPVAFLDDPGYSNIAVDWSDPAIIASGLLTGISNRIGSYTSAT